MKRGYIALGVGAAIIASFVLYIVLASNHEGDPASPQASHRPAGPRNADERRSRPPRPERPATPSVNDPAPSGDGSSERTVGDAVVRDHRTGDHPVSDVPPKMNAPGGRKIPSTLTYEIGTRLRPLVEECGGKNIPADVRGAKPRLAGEIEISIKDHQAQVTRATYQLHDITGDYDAVKTCVEQKSVGVMVPAADEADLTTYSISLTLRVP